MHPPQKASISQAAQNPLRFLVVPIVLRFRFLLTPGLGVVTISFHPHRHQKHRYVCEELDHGAT